MAVTDIFRPDFSFSGARSALIRTSGGHSVERKPPRTPEIENGENNTGDVGERS